MHTGGENPGFTPQQPSLLLFPATLGHTLLSLSASWVTAQPRPKKPNRSAHLRTRRLSKGESFLNLPGVEKQRQPPASSLPEGERTSVPYQKAPDNTLLCYAKGLLPDAAENRLPEARSPGAALGTVPPPAASSRPPGRSRPQLASEGHSC